MSDDTTDPNEVILDRGGENEFPRIRMRVGFDFTQAEPRYVSYVKTLAREVAKSTGGLRAMDITLKPTPAIREERKVTYWFVDLEGTIVEIAQHVKACVPLSQVHAEQFKITMPGPNSLHVLATGIQTWLVCTGQAAAYFTKLPPPNPEGPPTTPTGGTNVIEFEFRKAA